MSTALIQKLFAGIALLATLSSCGNVGRGDRPEYSGESTDFALLGTESFSADGRYLSVENRMGKFECPFDANVTPNYNYDVNGSREYKVCTPTQTSQTFKVLIHGRPAYGDSVCIFPIQETSASDIRARVDQATKKAVVRCISTQKYHRTPDEGVELNFEGVIFNAAMIVDGVDVAAMDFCLQKGILQNPECPRYSYGKFR